MPFYILWPNKIIFYKNYITYIINFIANVVFKIRVIQIQGSIGISIIDRHDLILVLVER